MKKILLSSIVLTAFAFSMILFQISCKKEATAETKPEEAVKSSGIVVYVNEGPSSQNQEIWKVNLDGTGKSKINISLPTGIKFSLTDGGSVKITQDGKKIVFLTRNETTQKNQLFSCNLDGTELKQIVEEAQISLGDVN